MFILSLDLFTTEIVLLLCMLMEQVKVALAEAGLNPVLNTIDDGVQIECQYGLRGLLITMNQEEEKSLFCAE